MAEIDKSINAYYRGLAKLEARQTIQLEKAMRTALRAIDSEVRRLEGRVKLAKAGKLSLPDNLFQLQRLQELQKQARAVMYLYGADVARAVSDAQTGASELGQKLTIDSLNAAAGDIGRQAGSFSLLPQPALNELTGQLSDGSPLSNLANQFGKEASDAFQAEITRGIALGLNPETVAKNWRKSYPAIANYRASRIMRTEMARASREASRRSMEANGDVVKEWQWYATIGSSRTCPMCYAMHGKKFPVKTKMASHPNCRCTMLPVTVSFEELGLSGVAEAELDRRLTTPGPQLFDELDEKTKREVLGGAAYRAYKGGAVTLPDFVGNTNSPIWGPGRTTRSLKSILGPERAAKWYRGGTGGGAIGETEVIGFAQGKEVKVRKPRPPAPKPPAKLVNNSNVDLPDNDEGEEAWVKEARAEIRKGIQTEEDARRLGRIIREQAPFADNSELQKVERRITELHGEINKVVTKAQKYDIDTPQWRKYKAQKDALQAERAALYDRQAELVTIGRGAPVDSAKIRAALKKVRPDMFEGNPDLWRFSARSSQEAIDSMREATKYFPKAWVEKMQIADVEAFKVTRGSMNTFAYPRLAVFKTSGGRTLLNTSIHEMGHFAEGSHPEIMRLQKEFYRKRTVNDKNIPLSRLFPGSGYGKDEKTKLDQFYHPYVGKEYLYHGTDNPYGYEIMSMGTEDLLPDGHRHDITIDPEMADFVLGILLGI